MATRYASAKHTIAECDMCGWRYKLRELKKLVVKGQQTNMLVCRTCWSLDHPQLQVGRYPVIDPQAVRDPRPDTSYYTSGLDGAGGSRVLEWGWNPVGGAYGPAGIGLTNSLTLTGSVGTVTVT